MSTLLTILLFLPPVASILLLVAVFYQLRKNKPKRFDHWGRSK